MMEWMTTSEGWFSLGTLTFLEIVLGIDNLIFISLAVARLPKHQQAKVRQMGLGFALLFRIGMLASLSWIVGLVHPVMTIGDYVMSWRDIILIVGGLFLLIKATLEIHEMAVGHEDADKAAKIRVPASYAGTIAQVVMLDIIFSLDSVITAVGMSRDLPIMVTAVVIAMVVMLVASKSVADFIARYPTIKMLALAFLLLIGVTLMADALHFHIPKGYIYFAIAFSLGVEGLNQAVINRKHRRKK
jgi:predicted tellurium resistance membrane protein TerC